METLENYTGYIYSAKFSPDGRMVVTASYDKTARLWDAATGTELQRLTHEGYVMGASFSPDGRTVLLLSGGCCIKAWKVPKQEVSIE